jgi:hypothetical protein
VLAHSLRDAGTKKKLAILVTLDSVSAEVVTQLKASSESPFIACEALELTCPRASMTM